MKDQAPELLFYPIVDALDVEIFEYETFYEGVKERVTEFGPWRVSHAVMMTSDQITGRLVSFFTRMVGDLCGYIFSNGTGTYFVLFNGTTMPGFKKSALHESCTGSTMKTLKNLLSVDGLKSVVGVYLYANKQWSETDAGVLVKRIEGQVA